MEEKINNKILEIKSTIKEITKHFNYTEEEINYLVLAYLSMIMIDDEIEDLIMESLSKTYILFTNIPVDKMYQRLRQTDLEEPLLSKLENDTSAYFGLSFKQGKLVNENLIIICFENDLYALLDNLIHELKHSINEIFPEYCSSFYPSFYSGLAMSTIDNIYYEAMDEAFNSYLVKIYLDNIAFLKKFNIKDKEISALLEQFKVRAHYTYPYERIVKPCIPLFKSELLFKKLYYSSLYKTLYDVDASIALLFGNTKTSVEFFEELDELFNEEKEELEMEDLDYSYLRKRVKIKRYLK